MDSANRERPPSGGIQGNPTNDIAIRPDLSITRMDIEAIELVSLEMPNVQRLLERLWSTLYSMPMGMIIRDFYADLVVDGDLILSLPPRFVPGQITAATMTEVTISTAPFEHGLTQLSSLWNWNQPIQLAQFQPPIPLSTGLGSLEATVTVIDPFTFTVAGLVPAPGPLPHNISIYSPPVPSPPIMATLISSAFATASLPLSMQWDASLSRFTITNNALSLSPSLPIPPPLPSPPAPSSYQIIVADRQALLAYCGFPPGTYIVAAQSTIVAPALPAGTTAINLDPSVSIDLANISSLQLSSMFFSTVTPLILSDPLSAQTWSLSIPAGGYTPDGLAGMIQSLATAVWPALGLTVIWNPVDHTFTFTSTNDLVFGIDFGTAARRFGMVEGSSLVQASSYTSLLPVQDQIYVSMDSGANYYYTGNVLLTQTADDRILVTFNQAPLASSNNTALVGTAGSTLVVGNNSLAHGLQVGDAVLLQLPGLGSQPMLVQVMATPTATIWVTDLGAVAAPVVGTVDIQATPVQLASPSLFLSVSGKTTPFRSQLIGFDSVDISWPTTLLGQHPIILLRDCELEQQYVLLEMLEPNNGSSGLEHRAGSDQKITLLGKIVLVKQPWLTRFFPMKAHFWTGVRLTQCRFRLINPDHSLYQLHGQEWHATFRIYRRTREEILGKPPATSPTACLQMM